MSGSKDIVARVNNFKSRHGIKGIIIVLVLVALVLGAIFFYLYRGYTGYRVLDSYGSGANASVKYERFGSRILRYSNDGISCLNERLESVWTQGYSMQQPMVDICGDYVAVGDPGGEDIYLFNSGGLVKKIGVTYMLEDFTVSGIGGVFAVLADGDRKYMKYFDRDGELIAEGMVQQKRTGYPMSFDISEDGRLLMMSYLHVGNGTMKTNIVFYNFDSPGEAAMDRIVASFEYKDTVVPDVKIFGNDRAVAVGDGCAYVYEGKDKPVLHKTLEYPGSPRSLFFSEDKFGMVFSVDDENDTYETEVYKANGNRLSAFNVKGILYFPKINTEYDSICFSGDNILTYGMSGCKLVALSGRVRFEHTFESTVEGITPVNGKDRFVLVTNESTAVINLT